VSYGASAGSYNNSTGDWTIPTLLDGASATLTVTTTSVSSAVNWSQVTTVNEIDPNSVPGNCLNTVVSCKEDDDASAPSADLSLTQSVNPSNPDLSTNIIFTLKVSNAGPAPATGVQVKDNLPSGLTYVTNTSSVVTGTGSYSSTTGIWTVGALASGASQTLDITATVSTLGIKTNVAEISASDQADPDSTPSNGIISEDDYATATITSYRSIIINEVAWAGTAASSEDQWIELYNPTSSSIDITGWTLKSTSPLPSALNITLSGTISSGGYFLLERGANSTDNSTISDITADQIYTGYLLSNTGEKLILNDSLGHFIDTANQEGFGNATNPWPQGHTTDSIYGSMERQGTSAETDSSWVTNRGNPRNGLDANNGLIYGTPRRHNSAGLGSDPTPAPAAVPTFTFIPRVGRPIINEFLPRPGFDWNQDGKVNTFDEFIEIKNIGNADISLSGWTLNVLGSNPYSLPAVTLKIGERKVFYGLQTNLLLKDGGDTVRLINPSGKIYDAYTYAIAKVEDRSTCRLPDGNGSWYEDCIPTPNAINSRQGSIPSMPGGNAFQSPVCDLPDTLPSDFLFAECRGYGADIWHPFYWDKSGWQGDHFVPANSNKWESFIQ
jgi:uncharacterized repeat protein (TIGR01451 family)